MSGWDPVDDSQSGRPDGHHGHPGKYRAADLAVDIRTGRRIRGLAQGSQSACHLPARHVRQPLARHRLGRPQRYRLGLAIRHTHPPNQVPIFPVVVKPKMTQFDRQTKGAHRFGAVRHINGVAGQLWPEDDNQRR